MEVKNKKVIITGGASGIGKELTKQLLLMGAFVYAIDINKENLENLKNELKTDNLATMVVDMAKEESILEFKDKYERTWGNVDILVNNAGIIQPFKNVDELDDGTIKKVMNVNFYGPVNLTRAFLKNLKVRKEAFIVNVSSMGGFFPFPKQTIYGASKAAIKIFTEGLYAELLDTNVHVMVVFPGAIATNITKNSQVEIKTDNETSNYKMLEADKAASLIIDGIKKNKFKLLVGSDAKFMNWFYNFNAKLAIKTIQQKMKDLN